MGISLALAAVLVVAVFSITVYTNTENNSIHDFEEEFNSIPSRSDSEAVYTSTINSITMGNLNDSIILDVTTINHTPELPFKPNFGVIFPISFEVNESHPNIGRIWGPVYPYDRYATNFYSDSGVEEFTLSDVEFNPTETGTFSMNIEGIDVWFTIEETGSSWSYDEPKIFESLSLSPSSKSLSFNTSPADDIITMETIQLTDSEVESFLQYISVKYGEAVTLENIRSFDLEDENVYFMITSEKLNGKWQDVLLFFTEVEITPDE